MRSLRRTIITLIHRSKATNNPQCNYTVYTQKRPKFQTKKHGQIMDDDHIFIYIYIHMYVCMHTSFNPRRSSVSTSPKDPSWGQRRSPAPAAPQRPNPPWRPCSPAASTCERRMERLNGATIWQIRIQRRFPCSIANCSQKLKNLGDGGELREVVNWENQA